MWPALYSSFLGGDVSLSQVMIMQLTMTEAEELSQMRDNIRRSVDALELCWSCQRVCECEPVTVDDGPPVWMCSDCATRNRLLHAGGTARLAWPFGS